MRGNIKNWIKNRNARKSKDTFSHHAQAKARYLYMHADYMKTYFTPHKK